MAPPELKPEPPVANGAKAAAPKVTFAAPKTPGPSAPTPASTPVTPAGLSSPEPVKSPPGRTPFVAKKNATPFPGKAVATTPPETSNAGQTPFPQKGVQFAGVTPHPKAAAAPTQEPPLTNRREKLAMMRDLADTPPSKSNRNTVVSFAAEESTQESAQLQMQRKITELTKENAQLNRRVAKFEDEKAEQAKQSASKVSFMPPASPARGFSPRLTPTRRRVATPHPKRKEGEVSEIDAKFLNLATEDVPYKFEVDHEDGDEEKILPQS